MTDTINPRLDAALTDAATTPGPDTVALMRILIEASSEAEARAAFDRVGAIHDATADRAGVARLATLRRLWADTPQAWSVVHDTVNGIAHEHRDTTAAGTLRYWAEAFDRLAARSPEASVALYSFGSATLLAEATDEVVATMRGWDLLAPGRDALDIGCGIGRFLVALAPLLRSIVGLDLSATMVREAERRCAALPQVRVAQTAGLDLAAIRSDSMDLILAADVFPYIVQAGADLAASFFGEMARVLRPNGRALILNLSYRGDLAADRRDADAWARASGLVVTRNGTRDLRSWDAPAFLLAKPREGASEPDRSPPPSS